MPCRALLHLARIAILPALGSRDGEIADLTAVLHRPDFRISAEIADANDLVDAACHDARFPNLLPTRTEYVLTITCQPGFCPGQIADMATALERKSAV